MDGFLYVSHKMEVVVLVSNIIHRLTDRHNFAFMRLLYELQGTIALNIFSLICLEKVTDC
jgi:hypothetical protein